MKHWSSMLHLGISPSEIFPRMPETKGNKITHQVITNFLDIFKLD